MNFRTITPTQCKNISKYLKVSLILIIIFCFKSRIYSQALEIDSNVIKLSKLIRNSFNPLDDKVLLAKDSLNELSSFYKLATEKLIISIGEATHGTDEIRKLQILFAQGLVANANFKVIALGETPLLESYSLFDYVVNGRGNINKLANMFHFNISSLLIWLNTYNTNKKFEDKIWILGASVDTPDKIFDFITAHCKKYNFSTEENLINKMKYIFSKKHINSQLDIDSLNTYKSLLIDNFKKNRGISDSLDFKLECMVKSINGLPEIYLTRDSSLKAYLHREKVMADNLDWMFITKGKTSIVFAHNFHTNRITLAKEIYKSSSVTFGEYFASKYKQKYFSIATEIESGFFYNGTITNEKVIENNQKLGSIIGSAVTNNYGYIMFNDEIKQLLNRLDIKITKGTSKSIIANTYGLLGDAFDGLFFIRKSNPYEFYDKEDYCTLYINLDERLSSKIIQNRRITLSTFFEVNSNIIDNSIMYSIYLNDKDKKVIKHFTKKVTYSGEEVDNEIPDNTKHISISLVLKRIDFFKLLSLKINNKNLKVSELSFYDWNQMVYKFNMIDNVIYIQK